MHGTAAPSAIARFHRPSHACGSACNRTRKVRGHPFDDAVRKSRFARASCDSQVSVGVAVASAWFASLTFPRPSSMPHASTRPSCPATAPPSQPCATSSSPWRARFTCGALRSDRRCAQPTDGVDGAGRLGFPSVPSSNRTRRRSGQASLSNPGERGRNRKDA